MAAEDPIPRLLDKIPGAARRTLRFSWLDRALRVHFAGLLELAGDGDAARGLQALPPIDDGDGAWAALSLLNEVLEDAADRWQEAVGDRAGEGSWEQVLEALGPDQVTAWSAFLVLRDDLAGLLERLEHRGASHEAALFCRHAAATLAEIRAGGSQIAATSVAEAVSGEEQRRQERELLLLLPS